MCLQNLHALDITITFGSTTNNKKKTTLNMFNTDVILSSKIIVFLVIFKTYYVKSNHEKKPGLIYMLLWSALDTEPFKYWSPKQKSLKLENCKFQNCYVVKEREYFQDVTDYDAILFTVKGLVSKDLPLARSDNQLYVFVSMESPTNFPFHVEWNWFFNYTWTYKLDSDIIHPYFIVSKKSGEVVGPKINARWRDATRMRPTKEFVIEKLKNKTNAAAWFVTNCEGNTKRLSYGHELNRALSKYNLKVDIYGLCGDKICPKGKFVECQKSVESYYYFYLAFENSYHEDYVTEKLLTALEHYAVPVVLGGANYSRSVYCNLSFGWLILCNLSISVERKNCHRCLGYFQSRRQFFRDSLIKL